MNYPQSSCCLTLRGSSCYSHLTDGETEVQSDNLQGPRSKPGGYITMDCRTMNFSYNSMLLIRTLCENLPEGFGVPAHFFPCSSILVRSQLQIMCVSINTYSVNFSTFSRIRKEYTHTHCSCLKDPGIKRHPVLNHEEQI